MRDTKRILFVCTGNTCRSYMAEKIAREYLRNTGGSNKIEILSAGTGCISGEPAAIKAATVLTELGYKEVDHSTRELNDELIQGADIILTMTERHKRQVLGTFPQASNKVFLLKEFAYGKDGILELKRRARELYDKLESKKREIYKKYQAEIESLEVKLRGLLEEKGKIEKQLKEYEEMLARAGPEEERELAELEKQLRDLDIPDPFGQPLEYYRSCGVELRKCVETALKHVLEDGNSR